MNEWSTDRIAQNAANIENSFNSEFGYELGEGNHNIKDHVDIKGNTYEILADYDFNRGGLDYYQKAVVLKDMKTGEIYFHFNGTGDGNWSYNAAAYGVEPQPSNMQRGCQIWFDLTMKNLIEEEIITKESSVYVTGHSQGGNNAMFVTMRSDYSDYIKACVPLDGPDFSNKFVNDTIDMLGKDEFDSRCNKIWAYTGENDYVDFLGQQSIVPEDHTKYVKYSKENFDFMQAHCATGMVDENGNMIFVEDDSDFRKLLKGFVDQIPKFPQEDQAVVAGTVMALFENLNGGNEFRTADLSSEDLKRTLEILIPSLTEYLKEHPGELSLVLEEYFGCDHELSVLIVYLIEQYGELNVADRDAFVETICDSIKVKDNKIGFDLTKLAETYDVISDAIDKMIFSDPNALQGFLEELGITSKPVQYAAIIAATVVWKVADGFLDVATELLDAAFTIYEGIKNVCGKAAEIFANIFKTAIKIIDNIKKKFRETFNKGIAYVKDNPYFSADTDKLRAYAERLNRVNIRLARLDGDVRGLYWQVGLLDIWDLICANVIISPSYSLNQARKYLNNTANRLENADRKAKTYLGG